MPTEPILCLNCDVTAFDRGVAIPKLSSIHHNMESTDKGWSYATAQLGCHKGGKARWNTEGNTARSFATTVFSHTGLGSQLGNASNCEDTQTGPCFTMESWSGIAWSRSLAPLPKWGTSPGRWMARRCWRTRRRSGSRLSQWTPGVERCPGIARTDSSHKQRQH